MEGMKFNMSISEIILISIGLAMDAFAVAVCKGLSMAKMNWKKAIIVGLYFGIFQAVLPLLGYCLGSRFESLIIQIDHWVAFILLSFIGVNMINEAFDKKAENHNDKVNFKTMFGLAIATSIDALAIGITFVFIRAKVIFAAAIIGFIAFAFSIIGVKLGNRFGDKYEKKAQIIGGLILILMGVKILLEHIC